MPPLFINVLRNDPSAEWVAWLLLGCLFILAGSFRLLYQHPTVWHYLKAPQVPSVNNLAFYVIVSGVCTALLAALLSGYVPLLPAWTDELRVAGIGLNPFGYTWWVLSLTDAVRVLLTFLLFSATGNAQRWAHFYYFMAKYQVVYSFPLLVLCIARYFFPVDVYHFGEILLITLGLSFIIKIALTLILRPEVLPSPWYYKLLYICTLQFSPVLLVAQLLFIIR